MSSIFNNLKENEHLSVIDENTGIINDRTEDNEYLNKIKLNNLEKKLKEIKYSNKANKIDNTNHREPNNPDLLYSKKSNIENHSQNTKKKTVVIKKINDHTEPSLSNQKFLDKSDEIKSLKNLDSQSQEEKLKKEIAELNLRIFNSEFERKSGDQIDLKKIKFISEKKSEQNTIHKTPQTIDDQAEQAIESSIQKNNSDFDEDDYHSNKSDIKNNLSYLQKINYDLKEILDQKRNKIPNNTNNNYQDEIKKHPDETPDNDNTNNQNNHNKTYGLYTKHQNNNYNVHSDQPKKNNKIEKSNHILNHQENINPFNELKTEQTNITREDNSDSINNNTQSSFYQTKSEKPIQKFEETEQSKQSEQNSKNYIEKSTTDQENINIILEKNKLEENLTKKNNEKEKNYSNNLKINNIEDKKNDKNNIIFSNFNLTKKNNSSSIAPQEKKSSTEQIPQDNTSLEIEKSHDTNIKDTKPTKKDKIEIQKDYNNSQNQINTKIILENENFINAIRPLVAESLSPIINQNTNKKLDSLRQENIFNDEKFLRDIFPILTSTLKIFFLKTIISIKNKINYILAFNYHLSCIYLWISQIWNKQKYEKLKIHKYSNFYAYEAYIYDSSKRKILKSVKKQTKHPLNYEDNNSIKSFINLAIDNTLKDEKKLQYKIYNFGEAKIWISFLDSIHLVVVYYGTITDKINDLYLEINNDFKQLHKNITLIKSKKIINDLHLCLISDLIKPKPNLFVKTILIGTFLYLTFISGKFLIDNYKNYIKNKSYIYKVLEEAEQIEGITIQSIKQKDGFYHIDYFRDPLADKVENFLSDKLKGYKYYLTENLILSGEDEITEKRLAKINKPATLNYQLIDGILHLDNYSGQSEKHTKFYEQAVNTSGVREIKITSENLDQQPLKEETNQNSNPLINNQLNQIAEKINSFIVHISIDASYEDAMINQRTKELNLQMAEYQKIAEENNIKPEFNIISNCPLNYDYNKLNQLLLQFKPDILKSTIAFSGINKNYISITHEKSNSTATLENNKGDKYLSIDTIHQGNDCSVRISVNKIQ